MKGVPSGTYLRGETLSSAYSDKAPSNTVATIMSRAQEEYGASLGGLRVAIIGAGVSGLAACKQFCQRGLNATVFEGKSGLGGVWRASYSSTKLQTPKEAYAFSDFPWPESAPTFPSHFQVVDYLESYARHFAFFNKIRFNSQVVEIKKKVKSDTLGTPKTLNAESDEEELRRSVFSEDEKKVQENAEFTWEVRVRKRMPDSTGPVDYIEEWLAFDYLVMCCGRFGDVPRLPSFPASKGPESFEGQVLHSLHYSALDLQSTDELLRGKKVVVVGFQKTSLDVAVEAANINQGISGGQPCTMIFRRTHWMYPRHRQAFGLFPLAFLFGTRFSEYWAPKPGQGLTQCLLQSVFDPVRLLVWKMLEYYLRYTVPVGRFGLVPEHSLVEDLSACVLPQLPSNLLGHLEAGCIIPKKTAYWDFYPKGVQLADGTLVEADVVILCTGYSGDSKLKAILPEEYRDVLLEPEGVLTLYRGVIHPQVPNMGFLGYFEGLSSVHSSEIGAIWLANLLQKKFTLPDIATMETDRRNWLRHLNNTNPLFIRPCVAPAQIWHTDKMCKDIGCESLRKKTRWQEMFSIYSNSDYKSLSDDCDFKN